MFLPQQRQRKQLLPHNKSIHHHRFVGAGRWVVGRERPSRWGHSNIPTCRNPSGPCCYRLIGRGSARHKRGLTCDLILQFERRNQLSADLLVGAGRAVIFLAARPQTPDASLVLGFLGASRQIRTQPELAACFRVSHHAPAHEGGGERERRGPQVGRMVGIGDFVSALPRFDEKIP